MKMRTKDLIDVVVSDINKGVKKDELISHAIISKAVQNFFHEIGMALITQDRVEIRRFVSMIVKVRPPSVRRNPKTNQAIKISAKGNVYTRFSKELLQKINSK